MIMLIPSASLNKLKLICPPKGVHLNSIFIQSFQIRGLWSVQKIAVRHIRKESITSNEREVRRVGSSSTLLQDVDRAGGVREEVVVVDQGNVGGGDDLQLTIIINKFNQLAN